MKGIAYKSGYKYQLKETYCTRVTIRPVSDIKSEFVALKANGDLTISSGYAWDGPSGPTVDTLNFMRGSLVHDALYQLMRERGLDPSYREEVDRLLQEMCSLDGMSLIRAWWVYLGVRLGGGPAADPSRNAPITRAPGP